MRGGSAEGSRGVGDGAGRDALPAHRCPVLGGSRCRLAACAGAHRCGVHVGEGSRCVGVEPSRGTWERGQGGAGADPRWLRGMPVMG